MAIKLVATRNVNNTLSLWITDGRAGGTSLLTGVVAGGPNGQAVSWTDMGNGQLQFQAEDGSTAQDLWVNSALYLGFLQLNAVTLETGGHCKG